MTSILEDLHVFQKNTCFAIFEFARHLVVYCLLVILVTCLGHCSKAPFRTLKTGTYVMTSTKRSVPLSGAICGGDGLFRINRKECRYCIHPAKEMAPLMHGRQL